MALDDDELKALAAALAGLEGEQERVPHEALVALAGVGTDLTVDTRARNVLGYPLVVLQPSEPPPSWWAALTPREREVALAITDGFTNKTIAERLDLSVATVKDHVHRILRKARLRRRSQVAALLAPHQDRLG